MLFLKKWTKNLEEKLLIKSFLMEWINFANIYFFCMLHLFLLGKLPSHAWLEKNCAYEVQSSVSKFSLKNFRFFLFVKNYYLSRFFSVISSQIVKYKWKQQAMYGYRLHPGKTYLPFEIMKNIKISDLVLTMNRFYDQDDI